MQKIEEDMSHTDQEFHRKVAAECFNRTWDYIKQKNSSLDDDQMMLNLAHASRYHWSLIGKPWNFTAGDWQISRVYAALNQSDLAVGFAKKAREISKNLNLSEGLIFAYDGMARAHAVAREYPLAREFVSKAREQLRVVSLDDEDRKI